ncbi:MAG: hypothetical protein R2698_08775 [Microthrixaceae bacterium]
MTRRDRTDEGVEQRRERLARWCALGNRIGWASVGLSVFFFVVGFFNSFPPAIVVIVVLLLAVGAVTMIPAMIFGYGIKAAEREERGEPFRY